MEQEVHSTLLWICTGLDNQSHGKQKRKKITDIKFEQNLFPLETAKKTGPFFHNLCSTRFKMKLTIEFYLTGYNTNFTTIFCLLVTFRDGMIGAFYRLLFMQKTPRWLEQ